MLPDSDLSLYGLNIWIDLFHIQTSGLFLYIFKVWGSSKTNAEIEYLSDVIFFQVT